MKRWSMLALAGTLVLAGCAGSRTSRSLAHYVDQDLRHAAEPAVADFQRELQALTGDKADPPETWDPYQPWWVRRFDAEGCAWMVLEVHPLYTNPGISGVRVHTFDQHWHRTALLTFPTGYRFDIADAEVVRANPLSMDLLAIKVESSGPFLGNRSDKRPAFEASYEQREFYALRSGAMVLVRLEDNQGRAISNHYAWSRPFKGTLIPARTTEEWLSSLESGDPIDQLATLIWLTGDHLPSSALRQENVSQEPVADSKAFESLYDSPRTLPALQKLVRSSNPWIHEYAELGVTFQPVPK